jgi:predicted permease
VIARLRILLARVFGLFRRHRADRDLQDELAAHLHEAAEELRARGLSPAEAERGARLAFGGLELQKEHYRDRHGLPAIETLVRDLRIGARYLLRAPAFSLGAILALAIGLSATAIVFAVANGLILRPLPISDPSRVVRGYIGGYSNALYRDYLSYRDANQTLSSLAAFVDAPLTMRVDGPVEHVSAAVVSGNYFGALGVHAALGRTIDVNDDRPGAPGVVVLSDGYWQRRFARDPSIVGRAITINGEPFAVIGVAPASFSGTQAPLAVDAWVAWNAPSFAPTPDEVERGVGRSVHMIGRLRDDVSIADAQADMVRISANMAAARGRDTRGPSLVLSPARTLLPQISSQVQTFVMLLAAIAGLVLAIACLNTAGLLLARAQARRREIAVRLALGAGRIRITRQLLTESALLSCAATAAAVVVTFVASRLVTRVSLPVAEPLALDLSFDWRVIAFMALLATLTTMVFGLVPAIQASSLRIVATLRGALTPGRQSTRLRGTLVAIQVALSTLLLVGAGVLVRGMMHARSLDVGFSAEGVLTASLDLSALHDDRDRGLALFDGLRDRVARDPHVTAVSVAGTVPLTVAAQALAFVKDGSAPIAPGQRLPPVFFDSVSPGYFRTIAMPILAGRDFSVRDASTTPPVAIINETLAARLWPGEKSPVGQRLRSLGPGNTFGPPIEVIGLVRNAQYATVGEAPKAFAYFPLSQQYTSRATLFVRVGADDDTMSIGPLVRSTLQTIEPDVSVLRMSTLEEATGVSLLPLRLAATLGGTLGMVALVLATIGISAMTSFLMRLQRREAGIRLALGATPSGIVRALTWESLRWTLLGLAVGVAVSWVTTGLLRGVLYDVSPLDPAAFLAVPALLALTAYLACRIPASRASRIDPLRSLRDE